MQQTQYEQRGSFGSNLARVLESSAATIFSLLLIPALIAIALLLPPISLLDRLQTLTYTTVDQAGATILDEDGTAAIFPGDVVQDSFQVTLESIPRIEFLNGEAGEPWREAAAALPNRLLPRSPLYILDVQGEEPNGVVLDIPIPNDSQPYETLDLYTWSEDRWVYVPSSILLVEDRIEAKLSSMVPENFIVMQTGAVLPRVAANVGMAEQIPAGAENAVTTLAIGGYFLRGDGSLDIEPRNVPPGNYEIVPLLRNFRGNEMPRLDLLHNLTVDQGLQENQLNIITDILVANGYPGVIIDYRGVDADPLAKADFVRFIERLAERLHAPEVDRTLAVRVEAPRQISADAWDTLGYDWRALSRHVDRLIVPAPVDPRAYRSGGEMEALLAFATDQVDRATLEVELPGLSVERSGNYLLLKGYQEALEPLLAEISTSGDGVAVPGESVQISIDNPRLLDRLTFDADIGMYYYSYVDDQGFERTVYIENAGSFAHKLGILDRYNVTQAQVRNLESGDVDPHLWDVARQFQEGILPATSAANLAVAYTVLNQDGSVLAQESRPLDSPAYSFSAPQGSGGEVRVEARIVENNQPVSQPNSVALAVATPTPEVPPTPTPTPTPDFAQLTSPQVVNVRSGPSTAYPVLGQVQPGVEYRILGMNDARDWWQIDFNGATGWTIDSLVDSAGNIGAVAVVDDIPPPPTPEPVVVAAEPAPEERSAPAAAAPAPVSAPAPTGGGSFGYGVQAHMVHNDQAGQVMAMTTGMGFNWVKQQIEWKVFEPSPGDYQWGAMDGMINAANAAGVSLLFSVVNAPAWAREPGFDGSVGGPPQDPQTFANFNGALAGKYCGSSVKAMEVWNEQNLHYEWGNRPLDPAEYVRLLAPSYAAIKAACPSMMVISGALTPAGDNGNLAMDDFRYLEAMFQAGLNNYADGIGAHPSGYNVPPSNTWETACEAIQIHGNSFNGACDSPHHSWSFRSTMEGYRNIAVTYGAGNKRIWPTEFGWAAGGAFHPAYAYANDNDYDEQARWTVEAYQMMRNWGWVGPAFLWNLNFRVVADGTEKAQWGIVSNNWSPLPIYNALRDMGK